MRFGNTDMQLARKNAYHHALRASSSHRVKQQDRCFEVIAPNKQRHDPTNLTVPDPVFARLPAQPSPQSWFAIDIESDLRTSVDRSAYVKSAISSTSKRSVRTAKYKGSLYDKS